jgi:hypothetical protein
VYGWFTLPYDPPEAQRVLGKDASIAAGSTTLVSPNAHFHASDVGKEVWIPGVLNPHTTITSLVPYVDSMAGLSDAALTSASAVDVKITRSRETLLEDWCMRPSRRCSSATASSRCAATASTRSDGRSCC